MIGMKGMRVFAVAALLLGAGSRTAWSQEKDSKPAEKPAETPPPPPPKEESSVTDHTIKIGGQTISYKATAATILLKNEKDEPTALVYFTAYTRSDAKDLSQRPVSFVYNGGPGSSSVWLLRSRLLATWKRCSIPYGQPTPRFSLWRSPRCSSWPRRRATFLPDVHHELTPSSFFARSRSRNAR